ncbi:hypothetical protein [Geomonas propionica]|uniref:Uncharacterized protein n=1 Tax=Geomonas propionica TaxID=2798582 RepID=A0ABS0YR07_9BACT|nr:hypothetical protein [Geomonas propionica]MBJ6800207.1 hypothetical protein [Geomonas propionica]
MEQAGKMNLSELETRIFEAHKATRAMFTFTTILDLAIVTTEGSKQSENIPHITEISELCNELALRAEDALCSVDLAYQKYERSLKA